MENHNYNRLRELLHHHEHNEFQQTTAFVKILGEIADARISQSVKANFYFTEFNILQKKHIKRRVYIHIVLQRTK